MTAVETGPAREDDIPSLLLLEQASFTTDKLAARNFRQLLRRGNCALVVARGRAGDVAALAGYVLVLFRSNQRSARLYSIAVDARFRGRGLGEVLLAAAEGAARQRSASVMRLEVRPDNRAAIRMYQKHGYAAIGRYAGFYEDGADALRLEKSL